MAIVIQTLADSDKLTKQIFSHRSLIPPRHDVLWRIERGVVRTLSWSDFGIPMTLGYWGAWDIVGHPLSQVMPYEIYCCTSVEMSVLPRALWQQALDAIILHAQQTEELLSIVHRQPVSQRLWQFLLWLSKKFGRDVESGRLIDLALTHQEIASTINITRVTVTRTLLQFESSGWLRKHKRRLILFDTPHR